MKKKLLKGECVEADDSYAGELKYIDLPYQDGGSCSWRKTKQKVHSCHETVNSLFKQWGILQNRYCHSLRKHGDIFCAVAVITQLQIENGNPLFHVNY